MRTSSIVPVRYTLPTRPMYSAVELEVIAPVCACEATMAAVEVNLHRGAVVGGDVVVPVR